MQHAPSNRRRGIAVAVAAAGLALLALAFLPKRVERPVVKRPPVAPLPAPSSPTADLVRAAESELLALCAERDRLLQVRKELEGPRADAARFEAAQIEIVKHVRDGERYYAAGQFEKALREFERADFKVRNVPYEVTPLVELQPLIRSSIERAKAALAGGSPPGVAVADEHYRLGERFYQAGDVAGAEAECGKALQIDPNHAAAQALRLEARFIAGQGDSEEARKASVVRRSQTLVEMDAAHARGAGHFNVGDLDAAEREFRKVLEYAKWMPRDAEFSSRRESAIRMLERVQAARR